MTTTKPTLLVAGGNGFIGRYVCAAARKRGYEVTTLGRSEGNDIQRDLRNPAAPPLRTGFDYAINLAAYSDHSAVMDRDPESVVLESGYMIRSLSRYGPFKRVLHVSTSEVFGDRRDDPMGWARTDDPYRLESVYARGKAEQERYAETYGFHTIRITNVWGEGQPLIKAYPAIKRAILDELPINDYSGGAPIQWSWVGSVASRLLDLLDDPSLRPWEHLAPYGAEDFRSFVGNLAHQFRRKVPVVNPVTPLAPALGIVPTVLLHPQFHREPSVTDILLGAA